jgi:hypothetical protein
MRPTNLRRTILAAAVAAMAALPASASAAGEQWIDGNLSYASGISCGGPLVGNYVENQVGGYTGYWGKTDTSYPKLGDRFWGHVYYQALGLGCGLGLHGVQVEIRLPQGTQLAIVPSSSDPTDKIQCFGISTNGSTSNVTDQPWQHPSNPSIKGKYCQPTVATPSANGFILSYALVAQGQALHIVFPLRATKKLNGIAEPNNASRMTATIADSNASGAAQPYQWNFVGDRPVEADCPTAGTTAASAITSTTAHTKNFMCNWYRSGKASIELGEGATGPYQTTSQTYNVGAGDQGFYIDQDWNGLTPGTTYHWRLKFVDDRGTPANTADDQTYYSDPRTFTTTGTKPPAGGGTPGAGGGGMGGGGETGTGSPPPTTGGGQDPGTGQTPGGQNPGGGDQTPGGQMPGGQIPGGQTPSDTVAPTLRLAIGKAKLGDVLKKGLGLTATCSEGCTVRSLIQLDAATARKLKLGKKAVTIGTAGGMRTGAGQVALQLRISSKAKKALARVRSVKVAIVVSATDGVGNAAAPVRRTITLKR